MLVKCMEKNKRTPYGRQDSAWQIAAEVEDVFPLIPSKLDFVSR